MLTGTKTTSHELVSYITYTSLSLMHHKLHQLSTYSPEETLKEKMDFPSSCIVHVIASLT